MWVDSPDKTGYWLFVGFRTSRSKHYVQQLASPCVVKDDKAYPEKMVYYTGSNAGHGVSNHEGKWFFLGDMLDEQFAKTFRPNG